MRWTAAALGILALLGTAQAQPAQEPPIEIEADLLEVRQNEGVATFSGNVDAVQGDRTLTADMLDVFYATGPGAEQEGEIERIVARGNVVVTSPQEVATGDEGTYDLVSRTIVLTGDVVLTREGNVLRGSRLEVDLDSGVSRLLPRRDGGRTGRSSARVLPLRPPSPAPGRGPGASGLVARHLGKGYRGRQVLRDVSVTVRRGEAVGLLGPNGAGKTTSFYIIMGLVPADRGSIELDGHDVTRLPMYRRARLGLGYLPQEASIFRGLTVEGNLRAVLEVVESDAAEREAQLDALLSDFALDHLRKAAAPSLSGGERRRVEIARALAARPSIMLLDEPLAGIDPINVAEIRNLVAHLKDRGIGVLITDHNVRDTLGIIDRAYILHDGQVLMEGTPETIVADQDVRRVYLGEGFQV